MSDQQMLQAMVDKDADPIEVQPSFAGQVCSISTHLPNKIVLLNCPGQLYTFLHSAIRTSYRLGILPGKGQQIIELKGTPFQAPGQGLIDLDGTRIHCAIVRCMLLCGWEIACSSSGLSLRLADVHSFFFQKASKPSSSSEVCAITFISLNSIRTTDAPLQLVQLLQTIFETHWKRDERKAVKYSVEHGSPEFQLKGNLWDASLNTAVILRQSLLAQMLSRLASSGYKVLTTAQTRVTNAGMRPQELDSWIILCPSEADQRANHTTGGYTGSYRDEEDDTKIAV